MPVIEAGGRKVRPGSITYIGSVKIGRVSERPLKVSNPEEIVKSMRNEGYALLEVVLTLPGKRFPVHVVSQNIDDVIPQPVGTTIIFAGGERWECAQPYDFFEEL